MNRAKSVSRQKTYEQDGRIETDKPTHYIAANRGCNPACPRRVDLTAGAAAKRDHPTERPAGKRTLTWEQQIARRKTRIAHLAQRLDSWGRLKKQPRLRGNENRRTGRAKLRFDTPELVQEWNKINAENGGH